MPPEALHGLITRLSREERTSRLSYVRVQHGGDVRLIPVDDVIYFKSQDKYTIVITRDGESLIRKPIKELEEELDPEKFWRIHRGAIVNVGSVDRVSRSLTGKGTLKLRNRKETLTVSNRYMSLFKQM